MAAVVADIPSPNGKPANEQTEHESLDNSARKDSISLNKPKSNYNAFAAKKTVAQGMMDIALITSNANQLRYVIQYGYGTKTYGVSVSLILLSLLLQVCVGIILIFKGRSDLLGEKKRHHAHEMNKLVAVAVFMVVIINIFIASFTEFGQEEQPDFKILNDYLNNAVK